MAAGPPQEDLELAGHFDTGEAGTDDHEVQQSFPLGEVVDCGFQADEDTPIARMSNTE